MRRLAYRTMLVLSLLALVGVAPAPAQTTLFINSGLTVPGGDMGRYHVAGLNFSASVDFPVHRHVALGGRIGYHRLPLDDAAMIEDAGYPAIGYSIQGGTGTLLSALGTARAFTAAGPGEVYGIGGAGLVIRASDELTFYTPGGTVDFSSGSESAWGLYAGAGFRAPTEGVAGFAEIGYMVVFTANESTAALPVRLGLAIPVGGSPGS